MESIILGYGGGTIKAFEVLSVKGLDEYEDVEAHNAIQSTSDDGTIYEQIDKIRPIITINFGTVSDHDARDFLVAFWKASDKAIGMGTIEGFELVNYNPGDGLRYEWKFGTKYNRSLIMKFKAKTAI